MWYTSIHIGKSPTLTPEGRRRQPGRMAGMGVPELWGLGCTGSMLGTQRSLVIFMLKKGKQAGAGLGVFTHS